jgi:hypothetical protein
MPYRKVLNVVELPLVVAYFLAENIRRTLNN